MVNISIPQMNIGALNQSLASLRNTMNFDRIEEATADLQLQAASLSTGVLGTRIHETVGGFQALTQELDNIQPELQRVLAQAAPASNTLLNTAMPPALRLARIAEQSAPVALGQVQNIAAQLQTSLTQLSRDRGAELQGFLRGAESEIQEEVVEVGEVVNRGLATLVGNPPGLNLVTEIDSTILNELRAVTGLTDEIQAGLNVALHSLPTPEAIGNALSVVANEPLENIQEAIQAVAAPVTRGLSALSILENSAAGIMQNFSTSINAITANIDSFLDQGFGEVLKDVIQAVTNPIGFIVEQLTLNGPIANIPRAVVRELAGLIDNNEFLAAARLLERYSNLSLEELETQLSQISTALSAMIDSTDFSVPFDRRGRVQTSTLALGSFDGNWQGSSTRVREPGAVTSTPSTSGGGSTESGGYVFTVVASMEELEAELRGATREITETVIHWTANYIDQPHIGAEDVHQWHLERGWDGCGYHYVIKRDGTIQRGRPINRIGAHALLGGHNRYSIGISHVAGYNCVSGTPNPERFQSAESITDAQWRAQRQFLEVFYRVWPGGQVVGHNQIDPDKPDPGINVDQYILNTFRRRNAITYRASNVQPPLNTVELNRARGLVSASIDAEVG